VVRGCETESGKWSWGDLRLAGTAALARTESGATAASAMTMTAQTERRSGNTAGIGKSSGGRTSNCPTDVRFAKSGNVRGATIDARA
jgi:hypothetical protein